MPIQGPGHAVSLCRRNVFGKSFRSEVEVHSKANSRCEIRPQSCKTLFVLEVLGATFDTEDHAFSGQKTVSLSSPGHAVSLFRRERFWEAFWVRSRGASQSQFEGQAMRFPCAEGSVFGKPFRSEVEVHSTANSRCEIRPQRCKTLFLLEVLGATFDTEDHAFSGQKTVSLSSPGHAVSLFRRERFWQAFLVRSRGAFQSQFEVRNQAPKLQNFFF